MLRIGGALLKIALYDLRQQYEGRQLDMWSWTTKFTNKLTSKHKTLITNGCC